MSILHRATWRFKNTLSNEVIEREGWVVGFIRKSGMTDDTYAVIIEDERYHRGVDQ